MSKPAIILLSGGLDSATVLAMALGDGYDCYCLSFSYGQKHNAELEYAERLAKSIGIRSIELLRSIWVRSAAQH